jgi:hypothetical protein
MGQTSWPPNADEFRGVGALLQGIRKPWAESCMAILTAFSKHPEATNQRICGPIVPWPAGGSAGAQWGMTGTLSAGAVAEAGCPLDLVREFTSSSCLGGGASASSPPPAAAYGRSAARPYPAGRAGAIMES